MLRPLPNNGTLRLPNEMMIYTADNCGSCQEGHPTVKTMPNLYDDDVTSLGYNGR